MSDDESAGPSLILAQHHTAHREHAHLQQLQHRHHQLHKKREVKERENEVVTEVVATVSVIQQINVDVHGNTLSIETILADSTGGTLSPILTTSEPSDPLPAYPTTTPIIPTPSELTVSSTTSEISSSSLSSLSALSVSTSTPSISSTFSSFIANSNTTSSLSSTGFVVQTFANSSKTSTKRSSLSYLRTAILNSSGTSTRLTSSLHSPSSSEIPSATEVAGGIAGAGTGIVDEQPHATSAADSSNSSDNEPPPTSVVVGGVIGSIAGVAIIVLAVLYLYRWKKRGGALGGARGAEPIADEPPTQPSGGSSGAMTEKRSLPFAIPAALAGLTGYKRSSQKTEHTVSSTAGSERGFYRVSGRKLPSVLQTGGDGYGDGVAGDTLSGQSFYRDSRGFYGGSGKVGEPSTPPIGISMQRDSGVPVFRPSPARTPVTEQSPFQDPPDLSPPPPLRRDKLGRSHPSQDGSRHSKFTEEV